MRPSFGKEEGESVKCLAIELAELFEAIDGQHRQSICAV